MTAHRRAGQAQKDKVHKNKKKTQKRNAARKEKRQEQARLLQDANNMREWFDAMDVDEQRDFDEEVDAFQEGLDPAEDDMSHERTGQDTDASIDSDAEEAYAAAEQNRAEVAVEEARPEVLTSPNRSFIELVCNILSQASGGASAADIVQAAAPLIAKLRMGRPEHEQAADFALTNPVLLANCLQQSSLFQEQEGKWRMTPYLCPLDSSTISQIQALPVMGPSGLPGDLDFTLTLFEVRYSRQGKKSTENRCIGQLRNAFDLWNEECGRYALSDCYRADHSALTLYDDKYLWALRTIREARTAGFSRLSFDLVNTRSGLDDYWRVERPRRPIAADYAKCLMKALNEQARNAGQRLNVNFFKLGVEAGSLVPDLYDHFRQEYPSLDFYETVVTSRQGGSGLQRKGLFDVKLRPDGARESIFTYTVDAKHITTEVGVERTAHSRALCHLFLRSLALVRREEGSSGSFDSRAFKDHNAWQRIQEFEMYSHRNTLEGLI